jgi:hypothetical protein
MNGFFKIFNMGSGQSSVKKVNFEDIQEMSKDYILINTLSINEQGCLIKNTVPIDKEEEIINSLLKNYKEQKIYIYGKNSNDESIYKKYEQILSLGLTEVYVYPGGLFEWLLLQDIYGDDTFSTNKKELDILKYKPVSFRKLKYLQN